MHGDNLVERQEPTSHHGKQRVLTTSCLEIHLPCAHACGCAHTHTQLLGAAAGVVNVDDVVTQEYWSDGWVLHPQGPHQLFTWANFWELTAARPLLTGAKSSKIHISSSALLQHVPFLYTIH